MRTVSFAGLHRMLIAIANSRRGLTATEVTQLVRDQRLTLTHHRAQPARTTIFHYRNTILQLGIVKRSGRFYQPNTDRQTVRNLLEIPPPGNADDVITDSARYEFASMVLTHPDCRALFFDLFLPCGKDIKTVSDFTDYATPVTWYRTKANKIQQLVYCNASTGRSFTTSLSVAKPAILYGLRYWARDQLKIIDEYIPGPANRTLMFPVTLPNCSTAAMTHLILKIAATITRVDFTGDWIQSSISDLIEICCVKQRASRSLLYQTIDWMLTKWPHHIVLIPTSESIATLQVTSPNHASLLLRKYYKRQHNPYISHIRIHRDLITDISNEVHRYA